MGRRVTGRYNCMAPGCREVSNYEFASQKERAEREKRYPTWACIRHTKPDEVLSAENPERTAVLVCTLLGDYGGKFWVPEGGKTGSGFSYGPGYKAFTSDFPPGTRLVVTTRIELPTEESA